MLSTEEVRKSLVAIGKTILKDIETNNMYAIPSKMNKAASRIYKIMNKKYSSVPFEIT